IIMAYRFGNSITSNHIGYGIFSGNIWRKIRVFNNFDNALAQLPNSVNLIGLCRLKMAFKNTFLRMPHTAFFGNRDYLVYFVYIQIATCTIITFQQWRNGFVPTLQNAFFSWVFRIKIDT